MSGIKHGGDCLVDDGALTVCEALYAEKVDEVLALIEALEGVATLCAGTDQESLKLRALALTAIATQKTDLEAAGCARQELMRFEVVTTTRPRTP